MNENENNFESLRRLLALKRMKSRRRAISTIFPAK